MKKIIFFVTFFSFFSFSFADTPTISDVCKYKSEFNECLEANENGSTRSIEDFVCIGGQSYTEIMSQIILDKKFKEIDKKVDDYFTWLETNKDYYFGSSAKESFLTGIDEIESLFSIYGMFGKQYMDLCRVEKDGSILEEILTCFGKVEIAKGEDFFFSQTDCKNLVLTKLEINKQVAYDVLKLNKHYLNKDENKKYMQIERTKYDELLEILMMNIGYMERIRKKWPSKTRNAQ